MNKFLHYYLKLNTQNNFQVKWQNLHFSSHQGMKSFSEKHKKITSPKDSFLIIEEKSF